MGPTPLHGLPSLHFSEFMSHDKQRSSKYVNAGNDMI